MGESRAEVASVYAVLLAAILRTIKASAVSLTRQARKQGLTSNTVTFFFVSFPTNRPSFSTNVIFHVSSALFKGLEKETSGNGAPKASSSFQASRACVA